MTSVALRGSLHRLPEVCQIVGVSKEPRLKGAPLGHDGTPHLGDADLLIDIDLAILGQNPEIFDRYDRQIRQEYAWVPNDEYRQGRARVLQGFLGRESIFRMDFMRVRFEAAAKTNLRRVLNQTLLPQTTAYRDEGRMTAGSSGHP